MSQLKAFYHETVVPKLKEKFNYTNPMQVPKIEKIVVNMGLGEAIHNIKIIDSAVEELKQISGQQPVVTRAKKSIAAFKLREGMPIGCMVTLRKETHVRFSQQADQHGPAPRQGFSEAFPARPSTVLATIRWASRNS
jgi:ribosomal protein L5